jgi:hypothetical protein
LDQSISCSIICQKNLISLLSSETLLDRYHSHTKHCSSCRTALKNLQKIKIGVAIATSIIWSLIIILLLTLANPSVWGMISLSLTIPFGVISWLGLSKLEKQFYQGREIPPRNMENND